MSSPASAWTRGLTCAVRRNYPRETGQRATVELTEVLVSQGALVAVQCSIGILFRLSQSNGKYGFSPASSLTLTELLKFGISCVLFARELRDKEPSTAAYAMLSASEGEDEAKGLLGDGVADVEAQAGRRTASGQGVVRLWRAWRSNLSTQLVLGFGGLAVFYAVNNNVVRFASLAHLARPVLRMVPPFPSSPDVPRVPTRGSSNGPAGKVVEHDHYGRHLLPFPRSIAARDAVVRTRATGVLLRPLDGLRSGLTLFTLCRYVAAS